MRGSRCYVFEIATRRGGPWSVVADGSGVFSRTPKATVRSIAERWIFEQAGQLRGGRLVIVGKRNRSCRSFEAFVRVRVLDDRGGQLAAAYVGVEQGRAPALQAGGDRTFGWASDIASAMFVRPAVAVAGRDRG